MSRIERLKELRKEALTTIETLKAERLAITDLVKTEGRADLSEAEDTEFRAKTASIKDELAREKDLADQIKDLEDEEARAAALSPEIKEEHKVTTRTEVTEPLTYAKGNGYSYFRDLAQSTVGMADEAAKERLQRHAVDVSTNKEIRDAGKVGAEYRNLDRQDGTGGYAVPPLWMMNRFIELARAGRTYANLVPTEGLPAGTDSINIPKINTGTAVAIQTADNATIQETDLTDTSVQANVKTIAGQQGLAIQLIDQSPVAFDEMVFRDLAGDYATKLNLQVISGLGTGNQVTGIRATPGIVTIAATGGATEVDKAKIVYSKIADAIQRINTARYQPAEVIVMHPRRWGQLQALFDADGRPVVVAQGTAVNSWANLSSIAAERVVGTMLGLPVVTDPGIPTNLGAGTNEDVIHVLKASDLILFESSIRTRALQETRATTLTVLLQVYGYLAFTAGRHPKSVVEIGGTSLVTPTFA